MVDFNKKLKDYQRIKEEEEEQHMSLLVPDQPPNLGVVPVTDLSPAVVATIRDQSQTAASAAIAEASRVSIASPEQYQGADLVLFKIRGARKVVKELIEERIDTIIRPIRAGLDKLYEAKRALLADLDQPLEQAEKGLKGKMAAWQDQERARVRAEEEAKRAEMQRLAQLQREEEARLATAKRAGDLRAAGEAQHRASMLEQERRVQGQLATAIRPPTKAAGSSARVIQKWRVRDMEAFICAVADGIREPAQFPNAPPSMVLTCDEQAMGAFFGEDRALFVSWPEVETYEETQIAGR